MSPTLGPTSTWPQLERIRRGKPMRQPSPFEGALTHDQWVYVHLRHAELHLSFLDVGES